MSALVVVCVCTSEWRVLAFLISLLCTGLSRLFHFTQSRILPDLVTFSSQMLLVCSNIGRGGPLGAGKSLDVLQQIQSEAVDVQCMGMEASPSLAGVGG